MIPKKCQDNVHGYQSNKIQEKNLKENLLKSKKKKSGENIKIRKQIFI